MQVFNRETTDYIAEQFYLYFQRKQGKGQSMAAEEAKDLIDYVQLGSSGKIPPESRVKMIIEKVEDIPVWNEVFDELIRRCEQEPDAEKIILLAFRDRQKEEHICDNMIICPKTYYNYRVVILCRAAVLAVTKGVIRA